MDKAYLTPSELARRYKETVSVKTLANWRSAGTGPPWVKIGGRVLYALEDVQLWEAARRMGRGAARVSARASVAALFLMPTKLTAYVDTGRLFWRIGRIAVQAAAT